MTNYTLLDNPDADHSGENKTDANLNFEVRSERLNTSTELQSSSSEQ